MGDVVTNLRVLKPSRKRPVAGDLFAMQLPDERYLFGRVVSTEAMAGPSMGGAIMIYVYRPLFPSKDVPERAELSVEQLLVPPMMTNRLPWSRGYFETVARWPLEPGDVLGQHCFRSWVGRYFDEAGNELPRAVEPVGDYGLHSYRTIDDEISDALGFEQAPD